MVVSLVYFDVYALTAFITIVMKNSLHSYFLSCLFHYTLYYCIATPPPWGCKGHNDELLAPAT